MQEQITNEDFPNGLCPDYFSAFGGQWNILFYIPDRIDTMGPIPKYRDHYEKKRKLFKEQLGTEQDPSMRASYERYIRSIDEILEASDPEQIKKVDDLVDAFNSLLSVIAVDKVKIETAKKILVDLNKLVS